MWYVRFLSEPHYISSCLTLTVIMGPYKVTATASGPDLASPGIPMTCSSKKFCGEICMGYMTAAAEKFVCFSIVNVGASAIPSEKCRLGMSQNNYVVAWGCFPNWGIP